MDNLVFDGIINKSSDLYEARQDNDDLNKVYKKRLIYQDSTFETVNPFNYAYGITIHKSQGSEYDNVLMYSENNRADKFKSNIVTGKQIGRAHV